ncbi:hypothetical protein BC937DRAFT_88967 [Endogone sp. FLAS-F59071]|nr:hypothetical protein BC937DRAFT_88967 [Endogone sp. FLAS-F59071]|eukprot:RUS18277.1 hypothetical protein BC937DRAFT_88967 [Endogone sp. FLAS-F59071]
MWNSRNPEQVAKAYTEDCLWRNRDNFFAGHEAIVQFLTDKWAKELGYRLRKELFAFTDNKIAVNFWYEFHDENGQVIKCLYATISVVATYGLEHWTFDKDGIMEHRQMSANNISITDEQRWFKDGVDVNEAEIVDE